MPEIPSFASRNLPIVDLCFSDDICLNFLNDGAAVPTSSGLKIPILLTGISNTFLFAQKKSAYFVYLKSTALEADAERAAVHIDYTGYSNGYEESATARGWITLPFTTPASYQVWVGEEKAPHEVGEIELNSNWIGAAVNLLPEHLRYHILSLPVFIKITLLLLFSISMLWEYIAYSKIPSDLSLISAWRIRAVALICLLVIALLGRNSFSPQLYSLLSVLAFLTTLPWAVTARFQSRRRLLFRRGNRSEISLSLQKFGNRGIDEGLGANSYVPRTATGTTPRDVSTTAVPDRQDAFALAQSPQKF